MSRLEWASHIAVIAVCILAGTMLVDRWLSLPKGADPAEALLVGKHVSVEGPWDKSRLTVLVAMTTHCRFCLASMPLYQRLSQMSGGAKSGWALMIASPEPAEDVRRFLSGEHIAAAGVIHTDLRSLGVTGTPTLLIIDSKGVIGRVFVGRLSDARERQLLRLLKS
ncbi:MAG TPA: hypothetical protein VME43_02380 [Bryobacteraceae bacterium]|nr:hypothetical protein [Bryobacteraceae bacterium]